jgi:hypothetical protein
VEASTCFVDGRSATARCASCRRALCDVHRARSGIATQVFGPFFDDRQPRCDDCASARFWLGCVALAAILGLLMVVLGVTSGRIGGVAAGLATAVLGGGACWLRARAFGQAARRAS